MNQNDFELLNKKIVYFDNGATTLKPKVLSEEIADYYNNYSANAGRGDYKISLIVDSKISDTRDKVKEFINAKDSKEIIFTSNATDSLNKIIFGYFKNKLIKDDEVLLTKAEHASNVLPWLELEKDIGINVNYISLNEDKKVTIENVKKAITDKTKVISIAHITNVIGDIRPIKEIIEYAHSKNILVVVDGAQSVPHMKVDVQDADIDFLAFSAHKMCGPTGVGILYGKEELLKETKPIIFGGGMNASFDFEGNIEYKELPSRLEAGTINVAGIIGFSKIIDYLNEISLDNITKHEQELRKYLVSELKKLNNIILYNENSEAGIVTFNIKNVFAQDTAIYLDKYNICIRAGNHCAKLLKDELGIKNTCRVSLYFYNTKDDVDKLVNALSNPNLYVDII